MIPYHKRSVQERGQKRTDEYYTKTKNTYLAKRYEANVAADPVAHQTCANQCFARVTDEPAQNHQGWNVTLQLRHPMRGKCGQQDEPPDARRCQQKRSDQDGIWRPKDRDRMRFERQRE